MARTRGHPVVAALLDAAMWPFRSVRAELIPEARGRVLEVGIGTGGNLPHYRRVESLTGIDPDPYMLRRAHARATKLAVSVTLIRQQGESLPFEDATFDTVVATWVLCTIPDPDRALAEMRRVLRPGGRLLFAEHVRSRHLRAARLQHLVTPIWKRMAAGCHLDRDALAMIERTGFEIETVAAFGRERWTLVPTYYGRARRGTD